MPPSPSAGDRNLVLPSTYPVETSSEKFSEKTTPMLARRRSALFQL